MLKWVRSWAEVQTLSLVTRYARPMFELAALRVSENGLLAASPGEGRLLRLQVRERPQIPHPTSTGKPWLRFVLNDYQLAVCLAEPDRTSLPMRKHPNAKGWIWPFVSKRAPGRSTINLWSSRNEVAIVENPQLLANALRLALKAPDPRSFEAGLVGYEGLLEWEIPRPPYRRMFEWQHLQ